MRNTPKIPVILATGFLGSGKTTLLRRLAESHPDWRLLFLVNEFAETSIDGDTLAATGTATHSVVGGSLFCECKAGDFLRIMRNEVLAMHAEQPLDAVVIETSGTADPDAIGQLMNDHGLGEHFEVRRIVTVVAPARFLTLLEHLPVMESQIQASDLVIINKTDTADDATIASAEAAIRILNPTTEITRAEQCRIDFILPDRCANLPRGTLSTCDANPFDTMECLWPQERDIQSARTWLSELPAKILRIKGKLQTPEGFWSVERTVDTLSIESVPSAKNQTLVMIAHEDDFELLQTAQEALR
jgi:G3E family GTPase